MKILILLSLFTSVIFSQSFYSDKISQKIVPRGTKFHIPKANKINIENVSLLDSIITYSDKCISTIKYSYNNNLHKVQTVIVKNGCNSYSDCIDGTKITYLLDTNDYVIEELTECYENGGYSFYNLSYYHYDESYNIISKKDSSFMRRVSHESFSYNESNLIIEYSLSTSYIDNYYEDDLFELYYYNDKNQIIKIEGESYFTNEGGGGGSSWNRSYNYDSLGNLIEYNFDYSEENGYNAKSTHSNVHYFYNSNNWRTSELGKNLYYEWGEVQDSTVWQYNYEYYTNNNLKISTYLILDKISKKMINSTKTYYEYNMENNLTLILRNSWDDGEITWRPIFRIQYQYNNQGYCLSGFSEIWQEMAWAPYTSKIGFNNNEENFNFDCERFEVYYSEVMTNIINDSNLSENFKLFPNYPNPFNPTTKISYSIPEQSFVIIKVFDVLGNEISTIVNENKPKGNYDVEFDGSNLSSGIYFYRIQAGKFIKTRKMTLLF